MSAETLTGAVAAAGWLQNERQETWSLGAQQYELSQSRLISNLIAQVAGPNPQHRTRLVAEWLVECFFEIRRVTRAKVALIEQVDGMFSGGSANSIGYAQACDHALQKLIKLARYERRAESQFISASRQYVAAESTSKGETPTKG